jgi:hypothetical protein
MEIAHAALALASRLRTAQEICWRLPAVISWMHWLISSGGEDLPSNIPQSGAYG